WDAAFLRHSPSVCFRKQSCISRSGDFQRLFRLCNSSEDTATLRLLGVAAHLRVAKAGAHLCHVFAASPRVLDLACMHLGNTGCCMRVGPLSFGGVKTTEAGF